MTPPRPMRLAPLLATALLVSLPAIAQPPAAGDGDLLAARDAAQRRDLKALEQWRTRFDGHPLAAYPAYWLLSARLEKAEPAEVDDFLRRHADSPLAEALHRDWLKVLGTAERWDLFAASFRGYAGNDAEVACHALRERILRGDAEALGEARALWLAGREAPVACQPAFEAAADGRQIGPTETWERIRKLLAAGHVKEARRANAFLPAKERMSEHALERARSDPARYLATEKSRVPNRAAHELLLFALSRLARSKPEEAAAQLRAHADLLGPEDAQYAWAQLAQAAAQQHHPQALAWFEAAGDGPYLDGQLAWRARAALRAGDWKALRATVKRMPAGEARDAAWRYWYARALAEDGAQEAAAAMWRPLARERTFYGLLAAEDLGVAESPDWTALSPAPDDLERVRAIPAVQRALALYRLEMNPEAFREWVFGLRGLDDRGLLAASDIAFRAGLVDRAIAAAERTASLHDNTRRYPMPHREALAAASRQWSVDEALLYGIIRQESRFNAAARSRVGATGLMQLMPATARWVAKQMAVPSYRPAMLTQPDLNVAMGTYYFHRVLADLGDPVLATAGYNAGPGRAKRWRDEGPLEGAIYAESIPFDETRDYVKKVMANAWFYSHRITGRTASLRGLMGRVPGRSGADATSVAAIP